MSSTFHAHCIMLGPRTGVIDVARRPCGNAAPLMMGSKLGIARVLDATARWDGRDYRVPGVSPAVGRATAYRAIADFIVILESRRA
ncbi:MAG: hypothetical protein H7841_08400 [Magnetospirillum sp. WYHS-4]